MIKDILKLIGVDSLETFSLVVKIIDSIRVLQYVVATLDWSLNKLDVKNVFLHVEIEEEVCMGDTFRYFSMIRRDVENIL